MIARIKLKRAHPALKHGGYSKRCVLPGEKIADFEKLHEELVDEFQASGPAEHDVVINLARLLWRKQNLETFYIASGLTQRRDEIVEEEYQRRNPDIEEDEYYSPMASDEKIEWLQKAPAARQEAEQVGEDKARKEFGDRYELVDRTVEGMFENFGVEERLDAMIDKCIKRLLTLKGVKSMIAGPSSRSAGGPKLLGADKSAA